MADNTVNTANSRLRISATAGSGSAAGNYTDVDWEARFEERVSSPTTWKGGDVNVRVNVDGESEYFDDDFSFDWRPSGLQTKLIASGTTRVFHEPDGTKTVAVEARIGDTGTSAGGGPAAVTVNLPLPTRKVVPGVPTSVVATRVSDTQVALTWAQTSVSNGQPTSNTIQKSVNGGAWTDVVTISPATSATVAAAPNQKVQYRVRGNNSAGSSSYSAASPAVFTTPAAPSDVVAAKNAGNDIVVTFTENVDYSEYTHELWHGTVTGGVTTWDGAALASLATGVTSYTHTAPNAAQVHVYRVRAKAGTLLSAFVESNSVLLLAAPNKPTLPALAAYRNKAADLVLTWVHNPIDSTPQKYYEAEYSTDGGSTWTSTGKVTSTSSSKTYAGSTWAANATVQFRVRTWGNATTGGSDGAGASPWSDVRSTTFKTVPVASIISPADASTLTQSTGVVVLGFSQAEAASFVSATIELSDVSGVLETVPTTELAGTILETRLDDGGVYTLTVTAKDSNGLTSASVSVTFTVDYLEPVTPAVTTTYLPDAGITQIELTFPEPTEDEAPVVSVTITRRILEATETIVDTFPAEESLTILDTTPTINGTNTYRVTCYSADGASVDVEAPLTITEDARAFLSKGPGFTDIVVFGYNLLLQTTPSVDQALVNAAGRSRPIGLYGTSGGLVVAGSSMIFPDGGMGSTPEEIEALLLAPGRCCYRDPSGRRVFGQVTGSVSRQHAAVGELLYTVTETS